MKGLRRSRKLKRFTGDAPAEVVRPARGSLFLARGAALCAVAALAGIVAVAAFSDSEPPADAAAAVPWHEVFTPVTIVISVVLLTSSAFFSASEIAFFSLHKLQLRSMSVSGGAAGQLVYRMMQRPGALLTTILMGNSIVNVLLSVVFADPIGIYLERGLMLPTVVAYPLALAVTTGLLVFFGEVMPKVLVVRSSERFARSAAFPVFVVDRLLTPVRDGLLWFTGVLFRVTRFSKMRPAPFITDDEFMSLLSEGEASGAIEKDEREMIEGILEFSDVMVREILVPRPDMIVIQGDATAAEALQMVAERQLSRIPVYGESLDEIVGVLYAKDLLNLAEDDKLGGSVRQAARKPHFIPETMRVADFVRMAQRTRTHMAIVVDEFGGTKGLVTLEDALREVVGAIEERVEEEAHPVVQTGEREYEVDGGMPLDDLEELIGLRLDTPVHMTVAGFVIEQQERLPETGDTVEHEGTQFHVLEMDGRRVARLRIVLPEPEQPAAEAPVDTGEVAAK